MQQGGSLEGLSILPAQNPDEKALMLEISGFQSMVAGAEKELAPNRVCAYIYDLSNAFNRFYHETKIIAEENETRKAGLIALLMLTKGVLEDCIDMLGFSAPDRM